MGNRPSDDFYETPEWVTEALFSKERFIGSTLEPACGSGAIFRIIQKYVNNFENQATDLYNHGFGLTGIDFLSDCYFNNQEFDNIITNPPYRFAQEFVIRALNVSRLKVAMFLRLAFLESMKRKSWFENSPLRTVYVMSKRVTMYPNKYQGSIKNGSTTASAWFVWEHGYVGKPQLEWL